MGPPGVETPDIPDGPDALDGGDGSTWFATKVSSSTACWAARNIISLIAPEQAATFMERSMCELY
jgi:hypothetical protein